MNSLVTAKTVTFENQVLIIFESKWMFVLNLRTFPQGFSEIFYKMCKCTDGQPENKMPPATTITGAEA